MEPEQWAEIDRACRELLARAMLFAGLAVSVGIVAWVVFR